MELGIAAKDARTARHVFVSLGRRRFLLPSIKPLQATMRSERQSPLRLPALLIASVLGCGALTSFQWAPADLNHQAPAVCLPLPPPRLLSSISVTPYDVLINDAARENHLDPLLLKAIISVESGFDPHSLSSAGACGLTQLMPATAKLFGVQDIYDPKENIEVGAHHFCNLLKRFSYDLPLSLAAYNAGEMPVIKFHGIPPYPETQGYVRRVLAVYQSNKTQVKETS